MLPRDQPSREVHGPQEVPNGSRGGPELARLLQTSRLAAYRNRAQLSQADVAKRLQQLVWDADHISVRPTSGMVSKWERGEKPPAVYYRRALCALYDATEDQLGIGEGEVPVPAALRGTGMVEWLSDNLDVPMKELNRVIDARSLNGSGAPRGGGVARESITDALQTYYGPDRLAGEDVRLYSFTVNGQAISTTMAVRPAWGSSCIPLRDDDHPETAPVVDRWELAPSSLDATPISSVVADKAIDRLAEVVAAGEDGPVMVDRPLYSLQDLEIQTGTVRARFVVDRFAHYALTYDLLERELLHAIRADTPSQLPLRDALLPDVQSVVDTGHRLCAGGIGGLLALARPESRHHPADFIFVVQQRSSRVLNVADRLSVMPKAFHQHLVSPVDEVSVGTTLRRELEEELFGREDVDESRGRSKLALNPYHGQALTEPMKWLTETDGATYQCTGAGLNLLTGNFEFACLIIVPDERFWDQFSGNCVPNWEAQGINRISSSDPAQLELLITDPRWTSEGLFAFVQGLTMLQQQYPRRVKLPDIQLGSS